LEDLERKPKRGENDLLVRVFYRRETWSHGRPLAPGRSRPGILGIRIRDHCDWYGGRILDAGKIVLRAVGRAVIDEDRFPGRSGVTRQRGDALPSVFELVPAGDDDRGQTVDSVAEFHDPDPPRSERMESVGDQRIARS